MEEIIKRYEDYRKRLKAYSLAFFMLGWDAQTETPPCAFETRAEYMGKLSEMSYEISVSDGYTEVVEKLCANADSLDEVLRHEVLLIKEGIDKTKKIPKDEYVAYSELMSQSEQLWATAKEKNDWESYKPLLEKIIEFNKKLTVYWQTDKVKGYDVLLGEYERGYTRAEYDRFFDALKKDLVPFVEKVLKKKNRSYPFGEKIYPREKQKKFAEYLQEVMCYDIKRGVMKESAHPFTSNFDSRDVRITVKYHEDMFSSAIFSAIHEMGHALYEQNSAPELDRTFSGGGASLGLHESQSRFYENSIGRSKEFWTKHFGALKKIFPKQLEGVKIADMYNYVNTVQASYVRVEADELTYPLHIMLRYDIEKEIFENKLTIDRLPDRWNQLVKEYLNLPAPDYKNGIMQDIHWAGGTFGYFPTYALGSAIAAQILHHMQKDFDVLGSLKSGNVSKINEWLKEKLHKYGSSKDPKELILMMTGEPFNPQYYIDYLIEKYSKIYGIK